MSNFVLKLAKRECPKNERDDVSYGCSTSTGASCPAGSDAVGDVCVGPSSREVFSSEECRGKCGDGRLVEIYSETQRDDLIDYATSVSPTDLYLGKTSIVFYIFTNCMLIK